MNNANFYIQFCVTITISIMLNLKAPKNPILYCYGDPFVSIKKKQICEKFVKYYSLTLIILLLLRYFYIANITTNLCFCVIPYFFLNGSFLTIS